VIRDNFKDAYGQWGELAGTYTYSDGSGWAK
jgi:hypothetical protein